MSTELDKRVKSSVAEFCGKDEYEFGDLSAEIDRRSQARVLEFIGKDEYEFGDITREIENRRRYVLLTGSHHNIIIIYASLLIEDNILLTCFYIISENGSLDFWEKRPQRIISLVILLRRHCLILLERMNTNLVMSRRRLWGIYLANVKEEVVSESRY